MGRWALGQYGEELAAGYLMSLGYEIIVRNWRCSLGEIDLVCCDGTTLVFVEVRTRASTRMGTPEESIDGRKKRKLHHLVQAFLLSPVRRKLWTHDYRVDVVAVELEADKKTVRRISHIQNALE
ncbi:MAG: YraN family protein [Alicyclobacillaceae bacterium]|nr:YraN family protein [Alicyclobacillaceae bacterium]